MFLKLFLHKKTKKDKVQIERKYLETTFLPRPPSYLEYIKKSQRSTEKK